MNGDGEGATDEDGKPSRWTHCLEFFVVVNFFYVQFYPFVQWQKSLPNHGQCPSAFLGDATRCLWVPRSWTQRLARYSHRGAMIVFHAKTRARSSCSQPLGSLAGAPLLPHSSSLPGSHGSSFQQVGPQCYSEIICPRCHPYVRSDPSGLSSGPRHARAAGLGGHQTLRRLVFLPSRESPMWKVRFLLPS